SGRRAPTERRTESPWGRKDHGPRGGVNPRVGAPRGRPRGPESPRAKRAAERQRAGGRGSTRLLPRGEGGRSPPQLIRPRPEHSVPVPEARAVSRLPARARAHQLDRHRRLLPERNRREGEVRASGVDGDAGIAVAALAEDDAADAVAEEGGVVVAVAAVDVAPAGTGGDVALEEQLGAGTALVVEADAELGIGGRRAEGLLRGRRAAEPAPVEAVAGVRRRCVRED